MVTIADGFTTCVENGDCLAVTPNPTPNASLYAELLIDPAGGIRCTVDGLANTGGATLALPATPACDTAQPGAPLDNAVGPLADGSPFIPDHFVGDKLQTFEFGLPTDPAIPVNTYAAQQPELLIQNFWCRECVILCYVFNNANVRTGAGSRFELRSEIALDSAPFVPIQHTPTIMVNSPTAIIQQDKATSASCFVDPYGFNAIQASPNGGGRVVKFRTGVFTNGGGPVPGDFWANVTTSVYLTVITKE